MLNFETLLQIQYLAQGIDGKIIHFWYLLLRNLDPLNPLWDNLTQTLSCRELPSSVHRGTWLWLQGINFPQGDPSVHVPGRRFSFFLLCPLVFQQFCYSVIAAIPVFRVEISPTTTELEGSLSMDGSSLMRTSSWSTLDLVNDPVPVCALLRMKCCHRRVWQYAGRCE